MPSSLITTTPLVALDIGKNVHVYGTYRIEDLTPMSEPVKIYNNRVGFEHFAHHIDALLARYTTVKLAHEPTGIYHEAFGRAILTQFAEVLATEQLEYYLVNPHLVKEARTALQRGRVRKTDAIDTQAIARCLQQGDVTPARFPDGQSLLFQQWVLRFRRNQLDKRRLQNHLMQQLDRLWPGAFINVKRFKRQHPDLEPPVPLVETRPLERQLVQAILTHCPNPYDVLAFSVEEMVEFLRDYLGRGGEKTARKVLRNVRQALLPPEPIARILAQRVQEEWQAFQHCLTFEAQLEAEADQPTGAHIARRGVGLRTRHQSLLCRALPGRHRGCRSFSFGGSHLVVRGLGSHPDPKRRHPTPGQDFQTRQPDFPGYPGSDRT